MQLVSIKTLLFTKQKQRGLYPASSLAVIQRHITVKWSTELSKGDFTLKQQQARTITESGESGLHSF